MAVDVSEDEECVEQLGIRNTEVVKIADLRFHDASQAQNDYTYFTPATSDLFNRVWAGPSHWKLKHVKPAGKMCVCSSYPIMHIFFSACLHGKEGTYGSKAHETCT